MNEEIKIGDRIEVIKQFDSCPIGEVGEVVDIGNPKEGSTCYQVMFDKEKHFAHSCGGLTPTNRGYNIGFDCVKLIKSKTYEEMTKAELIQHFERINKIKERKLTNIFNKQKEIEAQLFEEKQIKLEEKY